MGEEKNTENRADEKKGKLSFICISQVFQYISKLYNLSLKSTLGFTSVSKDFKKKLLRTELSLKKVLQYHINCFLRC